MTHEILRLGHLGDGIADGPVLVPRTLPGELVTGEESGGRISAPKIVTPSPDRVRPSCLHYTSCGGCALQHASDSFVASWRQDVVARALAAQGLETVFRPIRTSPPQSRRRAVFGGRRLKKGALVGFHRRGSHDLVAVADCRVVDPRILAGYPAFEELTLAMASRKSVLRLVVTASEAGLDVDIQDAPSPNGPGFAELARIADAHDLARLSCNGEVIVQRRPPVVGFDGIPVVPPPGAFLQATEAGEAALREAVMEIVADAASVCDLFSGCGTFALPLARGARVHAVEAAPELLAALDTGWRKSTRLKRVTTQTRDLFRNPLSHEELEDFDAVVIDPPRAGAETQASALAVSAVPVIAAISCNPVTFARDAKTLIQGGYRMEWVQVVDQFRWSPHIELAAAFRRSHMASDHAGAGE